MHVNVSHARVMRTRRWMTIVGSLFAAACAAGAAVGTTIEEAWARPAGEGANGAAYLTIVNADSVPIRLDSISSEQALAAELHETMLTDGIAHMTPLGSIAVPARGRLQMEPGGAHVMLVELRRAMSTGDSLPLRLHFSNGTVLDTYVQVRSP